MHTTPCDTCDSTIQPEILSTHPTSLGRVLYLRCPCGTLTIHLTRYAAPPVLLHTNTEPSATSSRS
ncbi:hypothetical protein [Spongiactinospora sp. 9N601]|uniref:hypothetical protein n=1 Tax=Spongiactinospora sp. 9N601 TaxID=3375149 RepID=UPI0037AB4246